jgi:hypothetical protein
LQVFVPELGYLQNRQYNLSEAPTREQGFYRISVNKEAGGDAGIPGLIVGAVQGVGVGAVATPRYGKK